MLPKIDIREYQREYHRRYRLTPKNKVYRKHYREINRDYANERNREYYQIHREQILVRMRVTQRKRSQKLKTQVLVYYGADNLLACVKCGFSNIDALTIDHINGNGSKHRRDLCNHSGVSFYYWLVKNNYPEGYQTLCMNCQFIEQDKRKI